MRITTQITFITELEIENPEPEDLQLKRKTTPWAINTINSPREIKQNIKNRSSLVQQELTNGRKSPIYQFITNNTITKLINELNKTNLNIEIASIIMTKTKDFNPTNKIINPAIAINKLRNNHYTEILIEN